MEPKFYIISRIVSKMTKIWPYFEIMPKYAVKPIKL
jgi:hypothetical protein